MLKLPIAPLGVLPFGVPPLGGLGEDRLKAELRTNLRTAELQAHFVNILLIKPSSLGDVVHTLPILNLLRRRFPKSRITWMLSAACANLLEGHPQLDDILL